MDSLLAIAPSSSSASPVFGSPLTSPAHIPCARLLRRERRSFPAIAGLGAGQACKKSDGRQQHSWKGSDGGISSSPASIAAGSLAALALSAFVNVSPPPAIASEFNILSEGPPKESHVLDDAGVLNRVTRTDLKTLLTDLEQRKGIHLDMVTLRKLAAKADVFELADQVLEKWYPTLEEGTNKGVLLLVTTAKEGAVTGGPGFIKAVGDKVLEGVISENLPVLATEEKYNEALYSAAKRIVAAIDGLPDAGGPKFEEKKREANFKTKEETEGKRSQFVTVVVGLLVISFVVPMAQYFAYVSKK